MRTRALVYGLVFVVGALSCFWLLGTGPGGDLRGAWYALTAAKKLGVVAGLAVSVYGFGALIDALMRPR